MNEFIDLFLAWFSVFLSLILAIVYATRKMIEHSTSKSFWIKLNRSLRKYHKELGYLLILVAALHGVRSSDALLSLNLGTYAWIFSILLALSYLLRKPLSQFHQWMKVHRYLSVTYVILMLLHINDVGSILLDDLFAKEEVTHTVTLNSSEQSQSAETLDTESVNTLLNEHYGSFQDGTYSADATGYNPGLKVEIVIENNVLTSITILDHNEERSKFYQPAMDQIPSLILNSQSLDMDIVTGSTFTSTGILNAVNNALSQALKEGTLPELLPLPEKRRK
jgi:uncharacterized protein with FMN-binding domain